MLSALIWGVWVCQNLNMSRNVTAQTREPDVSESENTEDVSTREFSISRGGYEDYCLLERDAV
jgi:hypothetical protein